MPAPGSRGTAVKHEVLFWRLKLCGCRACVLYLAASLCYPQPPRTRRDPLWAKARDGSEQQGRCILANTHAEDDTRKTVSQVSG